jgi:hypothetical protein
MPDDLDHKISHKYICKTCHYECFKKSDLIKHNNTKKHKILTSPDKILTNGENLSPDCNTINNDIDCNNKTYKCSCGKIYKHRQSLHNHKKICSEQNKTPDKNTQLIDPQKTDVKEIITTIMKQVITDNPSLMKDFMIEMFKTGSHNTINTNNNTNNNNTINNNNNSHNKTFNLQFFLNETCKNAMNISDFVDSIKLQLSDLITIGEVGYIQGITNIITSNLKALDVTERPIHCTDKKREIVYIKDENKWEKEDDNKNKLRKLIKKVSLKNEKLLPLFKETYPEYMDSESKYSDQYSKIVIEAYGGMGNNYAEKEDKIIRNISKATIIDKQGLI